MASTPSRLKSIKTKRRLAKEIGVPLALLEARAFSVNQHQLYSVSQHRKRSGGVRIIHAPFWPLANIQKQILHLLEELYRPSSRVMGFVKGRGIRKNAAFHVGKRLVLNLDIENYFGSIHIGRIRGRLMARPYELSDDVATTIAKLCTLDDFLPTGAPTSPILANIVTSSLDGALAAYAKAHGCFYTRYADDITFSSNRRSLPPGMVRRQNENLTAFEIGPDLAEIFAESGFAVQPAKTRLMDMTMRKEICGVTCNERLNVRREFMREVRGAIHAWEKYGRILAQEKWAKDFNWRSAASLERSLRGRIEHIIHIRGKNDKSTSEIVKKYNSLPDRIFGDIDYKYSDNNPLGIIDSICCINCSDDEAVEYSQGSGFVIEGGLVITNNHVVSYINSENVNIVGAEKFFPEIEIVFEGGNISYKMEVIYSNPEKDIALLRCKFSEWMNYFSQRSAKLSFREIKIGEDISLLGYPNHTVDGSCMVTPGVKTGVYKIFGQEYFNISAPIVKGNSGGPVVDKFGQVVGIATRGVDASDVANITHNGCISIHSISKIIQDYIS